MGTARSLRHRVSGAQERVELVVGPRDAGTARVDADGVGARITPPGKSIGEPTLLLRW